MLAQFIVNKLTGVAVCTAAIVFYFGGTMELTNCLLMLICSFILFEQLDSAGSFSALFRSIDIGVDKANAILRVEPMDIDGEDCRRNGRTSPCPMWISPMTASPFCTMCP